MMGHAIAFLDTVELLVRIFAHLDAVVKVNVSMVLACAWLGKLVLTAVNPFVALAMVTVMFQMCASVKKVGAVLPVEFQCPALTPNVQAMALVTLELAHATLAGKVQSVKLNLRSAIHLVASTVHVIVRRVLVHVKQGGVAMTA